MTSREFRRIALSFPSVVEKSHFNHPDFRVSGKIFATLGYPRKGWGMVRLTPKLQRSFVQSDPYVFSPVNGKWGLWGATLVQLRLAKTTAVRKALATAWRCAAPRKLSERIDVQ